MRKPIVNIRKILYYKPLREIQELVKIAYNLGCEKIPIDYATCPYVDSIDLLLALDEKTLRLVYGTWEKNRPAICNGCR